MEKTLAYFSFLRTWDSRGTRGLALMGVRTVEVEILRLVLG